MPPTGKDRNAALDTLRGIAILLMVIDHIAGYWFDISIANSSVRFITRLSMPLFCVLMGFFLDPTRRFRYRRWSEIALAAVAANLLFWPYYHRIEILGSLLVAYVLFIVTGRYFAVFVFSILLYPLDQSATLFDFPMTLVVSFVAQGMVLRRMGLFPAVLTGTLLASGSLWIPRVDPFTVSHLLCYFILPATLLVEWGNRHGQKRIPGVDLVGRHPLKAYLLQYYLIMFVYYGFLAR